jgi:hypothetical protein
MSKEKVNLTVSQSELVTILNDVKNPTFCEVVMVTIPKMNKGGRSGVPVNPYFGRVTKHKTGRILIGMDYEQRVNNNLEKEGEEKNFVTQKNNVGEHVNKCILWNENTQKFYLFHEWFKEVQPKVEFILDGVNPIEKMLFDNWVTQTNGYSNQGLEREVQVLSVSLDNVRTLTHNGVKYTIKPNEVPQMV